VAPYKRFSDCISMDKRFKLVYSCPECGATVIWSLNNLRPGATSRIKCANNMTVSRIDWKPELAKFCNWSGIAERQNNGDVKLYHPDGITLLNPFYKSLDTYSKRKK
jgi:predicted RNA-binding Zn-ribbon protein involved in translation (DUF1610 family)